MRVIILVAILTLLLPYSASADGVESGSVPLRIGYYQGYLLPPIARQRAEQAAQLHADILNTMLAALTQLQSNDPQLITTVAELKTLEQNAHTYLQRLLPSLHAYAIFETDRDIVQGFDNAKDKYRSWPKKTQEELVVKMRERLNFLDKEIFFLYLADDEKTTVQRAVEVVASKLNLDLVIDSPGFMKGLDITDMVRHALFDLPVDEKSPSVEQLSRTVGYYNGDLIRNFIRDACPPGDPDNHNPDSLCWDAASEVGKQHSVNLVVDSGSVRKGAKFLVLHGKDITGDILERLKQRYSIHPNDAK